MCRNRNALARTTLAVGFALFAMPISAEQSKSSSDCQYPSVLGDMIVPPENRSGEFRIALNAPDYQNSGELRNHLAYSTVWARLLTWKLTAQTTGQCKAIIRPSLFPDLRAFLRTTSQSEGGDANSPACARILQDIVATWLPAKELISSIAANEAGRRLRAISNPIGGGYLTNAENILTNALGRIYESRTIMHTLLSADIDPTSYNFIDVDSFVLWLQRQRATVGGALSFLSFCEGNLHGGSVSPGSRSRKALDSSVISVGTFKLPLKRGAAALRPVRHAVIVGHDQGIANGPINVPATEKYCNKEHTFPIDSEMTTGESIRVRTRCLSEVVYEDAWTIFFCDPADCDSKQTAEIVAASIAADQAVLLLARGDVADRPPRGPYLVQVEFADD